MEQHGGTKRLKFCGTIDLGAIRSFDPRRDAAVKQLALTSSDAFGDIVLTEAEAVKNLLPVSLAVFEVVAKRITDNDIIAELARPLFASSELGARIAQMFRQQMRSAAPRVFPVYAQEALLFTQTLTVMASWLPNRNECHCHAWERHGNHASHLRTEGSRVFALPFVARAG